MDDVTKKPANKIVEAAPAKLKAKQVSIFYRAKDGSPLKTVKTPGRNEPCWCKSGKKFKKCCLHKIEQVEQDNLILAHLHAK